MSSTHLETPSSNAVLLAVATAVGLHVLAVVALMAVKTPQPVSKPEQNTPPVEIQFVSLPAQAVSPKAVVQKVPVEQPEVQLAEPTPMPKATPPPKEVTKAPVKPAEPVIRKSTPDITPVPVKQKPVPEIISAEVKQKPAPKEALPKPVVDTSAADEQRKVAAAQARKAEQEAQAKAAQEAKRMADAKAAAQAAAQAKAAKAAEAAAQAKAEAEAAAALAQSNEPVSFTASAANWASAPNFSFPDRAARRARSGDTLNVVLVLRVNKQGGIDNVRVAQSSGNPLLDREASRQVRSGKFKPFTKNGVPVVGEVTLPISYSVP